MRTVFAGVGGRHDLSVTPRSGRHALAGLALLALSLMACGGDSSESAPSSTDGTTTTTVAATTTTTEATTTTMHPSLTDEEKSLIVDCVRAQAEYAGLLGVGAVDDSSQGEVDIACGAALSMIDEKSAELDAYQRIDSLIRANDLALADWVAAIELTGEPGVAYDGTDPVDAYARWPFEVEELLDRLP